MPPRESNLGYHKVTFDIHGTDSGQLADDKKGQHKQSNIKNLSSQFRLHGLNSWVYHLFLCGLGQVLYLFTSPFLIGKMIKF